MSEVKTPWAAHMGDVPMHLEYFGPPPTAR